MTAVYIHWPFCKAKCPYCDFNSHVRESVDHTVWKKAYLQEISYFSEQLQGKTITSIFFGGGTPTLMPPALVCDILDALASYGNMADDIEITLEGNPTSTEAEKLRDFKKSGINRLSLGVQSLNDADLKFLGREHSAGEALRAVETARDVFENYSFDLIYARPGQTLTQWEAELCRAMSYAGPHMSLYQLTIEKGTPFYSEYKRGKFLLPSSELSEELYLATEDLLSSKGLRCYEVSNYAVPGKECQHNLAYWRYDDYLGIGPGAHGRLTLDNKKTATMTIHHPENWLTSVQKHGHGIQTRTVLADQEVLEELLIMGLRIKEGISAVRFAALTGRHINEVFPQKKLAPFIDEGLLEVYDGGMNATDKGRLLLNSLVSGLLGLKE